MNRAIDGVNESWTDDDLDRATNDINVLGQFSTTCLDATRQVSSLNYPNGQQTLFSYYNNVGDRHLSNIVYQITGGNPGGSMWKIIYSQFGYKYDAIGEITQWTQLLNAQP